MRGMDLVTALSVSPASGAPLVFTGGDTKTELLKEPPRTVHDSLYIADVINARAGLQPPVMRSVTYTAAGVAGDCDLVDTSSNVYGGGSTADAAGSLALFAQVRANSSAFFNGGNQGIEVYGLLVDIQSAQNVALPAIDFDVRGCSMGASSYNASATGSDPGATWSYTNATNANINLSGSVGPPSGVSQDPRQRIRFLILPAVSYNGSYYYTPFVCRPTQAITAFTPTYQQAPTLIFPGRAVIHCRLNSGTALPTGTTVNYQLLTRGCPDVEELIRRRAAAMRTLTRIVPFVR